KSSITYREHRSEFRRQKTCQFLQLNSNSAATRFSPIRLNQGANMTRLIFSCVVLTIAFSAAGTTALAQRETATGVEVEKDLALLRRDLRSDKKQLIALNLP